MSQGRPLSIIYLSERFVGARKMVVRLDQGKNYRKKKLKFSIISALLEVRHCCSFHLNFNTLHFTI